MMKQKISVLLTIAMLCSLVGVRPTARAVTYNEWLYEAEEAVSQGTGVNTNHPGYTGSGFVDKFDAPGDYVQFTISIPVTGDYSITFRYANAGGYYASYKVYFDGEYEATAVFPSLSNWDIWGTAEVGNYLTQGTHTVKIEYNNHAINLDNLTVEEKHESTRSFYLSNQQDMVGIWKAAQLCSVDVASKGPRLDELHVSFNWGQNQLKDYSGFFRDETSGAKYTDGSKFSSEGFFDETGILRTNYLKYNEHYPAGLEFSRDYATVPGMGVIVTKYTIENTSPSSKSVSILDMLNPSNVGTGNISASYDAVQKAIVFNRSAAGQPYIALGAFTTPTGYQVADDSVTNPSAQNCSPWYTFHGSGTVKNNASQTAHAVSGGMLSKVSIPANSSVDVYFYIAVGSSTDAINGTIAAVTAQSGAYWFGQTQDYYDAWLENVAIPNFSDPELTLMYKRNLILIKNSLRPGNTTADGAHPATTNPFDYGYKVWTRDASVTAVALDAAGLTAEGARYWRWLAARQLTGDSYGQFNTCIDFWTNQRAEFIEPEHDTIGWFLYGVYRHCLEVGSNQLSDDLWKQLTASADYVMNNIDENGFGPHDFSIWEDMDNFGVYTYTQALYVAGLEAMAKMARAKGLNDLADSYNGAASTIKTAINRDDTLSTGLWYPQGGYYNKDIRWDNSVNHIKDAAGLILFVTGVVDVESSRARSTLAEFEEDLADDTFGLARFAMDTYYSKDSIYSPSGDEAVEVSPSWPQVANWNAVCNTYLGNQQKAADIFNWHLHRTGAGYMVTGECISDVTEKPCVSTASEPTTAAAFVLAALVWDGTLDMRITPEQSNAGCYRELSVHAGCAGDWPQYQYVPYYRDELGDAVYNNQSIRKTYVANDVSNLFIRIDNESGVLPGYSDPDEVFKTAIYIQGPSGAVSTNCSLNGTPFTHSASFAFVRSSDSNSIVKYTAGPNNTWVSSGSISNAQFEWDTLSGRIEIRLPFSTFGVSGIGSNTWLNTQIILGSGTTDSDSMTIHYRLTASDQAWVYGDFE